MGLESRGRGGVKLRTCFVLVDRERTTANLALKKSVLMPL